MKAVKMGGFFLRLNVTFARPSKKAEEENCHFFGRRGHRLEADRAACNMAIVMSSRQIGKSPIRTPTEVGFLQ